ncbi:nuclear transport factor 2 family protein [bacterium]|nr:nuclear transport factor 2 family protein [bacterium]
MAIDIENTLKDYCAAWCEPDVNKRRAFLENAWSDDGIYQDPLGEAAGREQLIALIGGMHHKFPGARVEITSGVSKHHGKIYFEWQMLSGDGNVAFKGVDFGSFSAEGRLAQIVGFFVPTPAL